MSKNSVCPICKNEVELNASNTYRPFCSKRCRLIDLGEWINENYSVSENKTAEDSFKPDSIQKH